MVSVGNPVGPPESPLDMTPLIKTSLSLYSMYLTGLSPPARQTSMTTSGMCVPLQAASWSLGVAASSNLTMLNSEWLTSSALRPPAVFCETEAGWVIAWLYCNIITQSLWSLSVDSPLISPKFTNPLNAMVNPLLSFQLQLFVSPPRHFCVESTTLSLQRTLQRETDKTVC